MSGLARTGSAMTNGSGDYAIAFSTAPDVRIKAGENIRTTKFLSNDAMSPLFLAVIKATEEAIYNSLFRATTMKGKQNRTVEALPVDETLKILRKSGKLNNSIFKKKLCEFSVNSVFNKFFNTEFAEFSQRLFLICLIALVY